MTLVQTELESVYNPSDRMITWLPYDARVKPGKRITLKDDPRLWLVVAQFGKTDSSNLKRGWNNNY